MTTLPTPDETYEREERIAIKMDSHIPEDEAIRQTDEEAEQRRQTQQQGGAG